MRENKIQTGIPNQDGRRRIESDWFMGGIPGNVSLDHNVYIDSSYGFAAFHSQKEKAMCLGEGSGCYDRSSFITGKGAEISIGKFTIINGATIICHKTIVIGSHCMLAWGAVVTDTWLSPVGSSVAHRQTILKQAAENPDRILPAFAEPLPVMLEDNCWIGFDAIILPGVRVGQGAVIGCKTVINQNIPPYAVVVGNPAKIIRFLEPNDTKEAKTKAFAEHLSVII